MEKLTKIANINLKKSMENIGTVRVVRDKTLVPSTFKNLTNWLSFLTKSNKNKQIT
jgi:hypothetical protein